MKQQCFGAQRSKEFKYKRNKNTEKGELFKIRQQF